MNFIAFMHAYKFTHFTNANIAKTPPPEKLSLTQKLKTLFLGANLPRPQNKLKPANYTSINLKSNATINCWYLQQKDSTLGTVIIYHGYGGEKSSLLDKATILDSLKYNVLLVDFMGSGASAGNTTTIGFKEAEQVKTTFEFIKNKGEKNIYLFGTSLGAAAIMKAVNDNNLSCKIMLECPFGTMYKTVCARFTMMHLPSWPMAYLLVFWGGVQNGFWAFSHNPEAYAKNIQCPTLLMCGTKDPKVSMQETYNIYNNLQGAKTLKLFNNAGHENYLNNYKAEWTETIFAFLQENNSY